MAKKQSVPPSLSKLNLVANIKMIPIETSADLAACAQWDGVADWLIFDAKVAKGTQPAALAIVLTGQFYRIIRDHTVDAGRRVNHRYSRRGSDNSGTGAVDVSSGVEHQRGKR